MDSIVSVQNKIFSGDDEKFVTMLGAVAQTKSYIHRQFIGIWKNLVKIYHGITELQHLIDPRQMASLMERYVE